MTKLEKRRIKPNLKNMPIINIYEVERWDCENLWETKQKLFAIEQGGHVIIMDLKSMQNIARILDSFLTNVIGKEVHDKLRSIAN